MQLKSWHTLLTVLNIHVVTCFLRWPSSFSPRPADMYSLHDFKLHISPKYKTKRQIDNMWSPWEHYQILFKHKCNTKKHLHTLTSLYSTYNLFFFLSAARHKESQVFNEKPHRLSWLRKHFDQHFLGWSATSEESFFQFIKKYEIKNVQFWWPFRIF